MPSSPRGWFCRSIYILEAQGRTFSPQMDLIRGTGPIYSREEALSVKIIAERASHAVCGNGVGYKLLLDYYAGEMSWFAFSDPDRALLRRVIRCYAKGLREAGFLPAEDGIDRGL